MKRFKTELLILLVILIISGCSWSRVRAYSGPQLGQKELSFLKIAGPVNVVRIDGKAASAKKYDMLELIPGKHSIIAIPDSNYNVTGIAVARTFTTEKGHVYDLVFHMQRKSFFSDSGDWSFEIIDVTKAKRK